MSQIHDQLSSSYVPVASVTPQDGKDEDEADGDAEEGNDDFYLDELIMLASDPSAELSPHTLTATPSSTSTPTLTQQPTNQLLQHADSTSISSDPTTAVVSIAGDSFSRKRKAATSRSIAAELKAQAKAAAKKAKADAAKVTSLFASGETVVFSEDALVYTDKPLAESLELKYRGTFTVYLDADSRIFRYEFIYTAEDVFLAAAAAAAAGSENSGDSITSESGASASGSGSGV